MHPLLNVAITAARQAGEIMLRYRERIDSIKVSQKAANDLVSEVDVMAEQAIINTLSKAYPSHGFIAEESGISHHDAESVWIIDPLDGTNNYLHSFPFFCVSIAHKVKNKVEHAVIFDPLHQECFVASRGNGAQLNDRKLRIS
ncbi:MAG: inositol monophosphatase family protein, partial [Methylococcales bacterium]|nr:inositol monophosphatase family protein [Methylococcales bacterium]